MPFVFCPFLHVPPSHKKIYIPLSLVHLIYTVGDNCIRQNASLEYIKASIQDTLTSLRTAPIHMSALFPDHLISKAEVKIRHHEDKRTSGHAQ